MRFKNEALPAANPYPPIRRGDHAVIRAGCPASRVSPESIPPPGEHTCLRLAPKSPRAHTRAGVLSCSPGKNAILPPSCTMVPDAARLSLPSPSMRPQDALASCLHRTLWGMLPPRPLTTLKRGARQPAAGGEGERQGAPHRMAPSPFLAPGSAGVTGCLVQRPPACSTALASAREK